MPIMHPWRIPEREIPTRNAEFVDRLYQPAYMKEPERARLAAKHGQALRDECTFTPNITKKAKKVKPTTEEQGQFISAYLLTTGQPAQVKPEPKSKFEKLHDQHKEKKKELKEKQRQKEEEDMKPYTFKPNLEKGVKPKQYDHYGLK